MSRLENRIFRVLAGALLAATSPAVQAQNMLINPDFASDLSGWTLQPSGGNIAWTSLDANSSATSGSVEVTTVRLGFGTRVRQCLSASGEQAYKVGAKTLVPSGQTATGTPYLKVDFWSDSFCQQYIDGTNFFADQVFDTWIPFNTMAVQSPPGTGSVLVTLDPFGGTAQPFTAYYDDVMLAPSEGCLSGAERLCLNDDRFEVTVDWRKPNGETGVGKARTIDGIGDSGLFWFFGKQNLEMLVKVIDGCKSSFNSFWVFFAATTDVEFTLRVYDTVSEIERTYFNAQGHPANAVTDVAAFFTCQ